MFRVFPWRTGDYLRLIFCWQEFIWNQPGKLSILESWNAGQLAHVHLTITCCIQVKFTITKAILDFHIGWDFIIWTKQLSTFTIFLWFYLLNITRGSYIKPSESTLVLLSVICILRASFIYERFYTEISSFLFILILFYAAHTFRFVTSVTKGRPISSGCVNFIYTRRGVGCTKLNIIQLLIN